MREAKVVTCFLLRRTPGGDEILLLGTGAGLSIGGVILVY